jgi:menaquinone-specific isochorismate synthase
VTSAPDLKAITVRSVGLDAPGPLPSRLPAGPVFSWVREGDGMIGWGELTRYEWTGGEGAAGAGAWWRDWCRGLQVRDEVGLPGTGPVAFGSLAFDQRTASSALVVPRVILGRRGDHAWLTTFGDDAALPEPGVFPHPTQVRYADGALSPDQWGAAVAEAVRRIRAGELHKVVLARDLVATTEPPVDVRSLLVWLADRYPSCWTYSVDGLVGATPELLVRRRGNRVDSRVLAGTSWRGSVQDDQPDHADSRGQDDTDEAERHLMASTKDLGEHEYAAASTARILTEFCSELDVPPPSLLRLPNVSHLATEIVGTLNRDVSSIELAGALNLTAAVCGTPTEVAVDLIPELERMPRGRYAGPIGWVDAAGDGDWGIALRGAQVDGAQVRMFAGCGIVAGSEPDRELAETQAKFIVMRDALESRDRT